MNRVWPVGLVGGLLLVFGLACLNYTRKDGWEHHRESASRHGWPPPSGGIFYLGVLTTVLGSAAGGFASGRRGGPGVREGAG
jgi:hypothetical protein